MSNYWGNEMFSHGSFPDVGEKQKAQKERKRKKVNQNNGQFRLRGSRLDQKFQSSQSNICLYSSWNFWQGLVCLSGTANLPPGGVNVFSYKNKNYFKKMHERVQQRRSIHQTRVNLECGPAQPSFYVTELGGVLPSVRPAEIVLPLVKVHRGDTGHDTNKQTKPQH